MHRYPSKKVTKHDETANDGDLNRQKERILRNQFDSPADRGDMRNLEDAQNVDLRNSVSPVPREEIDFIKLNKERTSIATKLATQLNNGVPPPNYRKGVVPKYDIASNFFSFISLYDFKRIFPIICFISQLFFFNIYISVIINKK